MFPNFRTAQDVKGIWRITNTIPSIWAKNKLRYLSLDIICSSKLRVFPELRSWNTVRILEQVMSAGTFQDQNYGGYCLFVSHSIYHQEFSQTNTFEIFDMFYSSDIPRLFHKVWVLVQAHEPPHSPFFVFGMSHQVADISCWPWDGCHLWT